MTKPLHFSVLKQIARSPAHAELALREPTERTTSMLLGTAVHAMLLGGAPISIFPGATRRGKEWDAFEAGHAGDIILNAREHGLAKQMAGAVHRSGPAMAALDGDYEVPREWEWCGRLCATRGIDVLAPSFITDLKTTRCSDPKWFRYECAKLAYAEQLCWYANAVEGHRELRIVAVESAAPFNVTVLRMSDSTRLMAERRLRLWMEMFLACEESGEWPGYVQSEVDLDTTEDTDLDFDGLEEAS